MRAGAAAVSDGVRVALELGVHGLGERGRGREGEVGRRRGASWMGAFVSRVGQTPNRATETVDQTPLRTSDKTSPALGASCAQSKAVLRVSRSLK